VKIAFVAHNVNKIAGTPRVTAALIERFCDEHEVTVFSHTIEGVDISKIEYHKVPAVPGTWVVNYLLFLFCSTIMLAFWKLLRRKNFDIIHCSTGYDCLFFANVVTSHFCERECHCLEEAGIINVPAWPMFHKLKNSGYRIYRRLVAFVEELTFGSKSSGVRIVVSQRLKDDFIRHYGDAVKDIVVIPNGTDCRRFSPTNKKLYRGRVRQRYGIAENGLVVLFVGSDWQRKGVYYLIEALTLIPCAEVNLWIVGSGDTSFYAKLAEEKAIRERVTFIPHTRKVWEFYAAGDIFVLPALYEPFGLVISEAMASGLPVITSKRAGAADFITDGVNGFLIDDPREVDELAAKINLLVSDSHLRETMGKRARMAAEEFSWDEVAKETLAAYTGIA